MTQQVLDGMVLTRGVTYLTPVTNHLLVAYERHQINRNLRPRSIVKTGEVLRHLIRNTDGELLDLTKGDLEQWLDAVPRKPRSRYSLISHVYTFFEWAVREGHAETNPARTIDRPRLRRGLPRPIPHADLSLAVHQAPSMFKAWLLLGALEGLRCQEIAGVCRDHVLDAEDPGLLIIAEAKGGQERFVPLHPDVLAALNAHGMEASGPIFRNAFGQPYSPERVSQLGNAYLRSVGVKSTMHQLRHRFGTDAYRLCKDLRVVQELMGHQSTNSTAIYVEMDQAEAVAVVQQLRIHPLVAAA